MKTQSRNDKIQEALELLNEAAKEKSEELYGIVEGKYSHIKQLLKDQTTNGKEMMGEARKRFAKTLQAEEERLVETARNLDKKVHRNPWPFLGAAALGALIVGVALGKK
ncbi:MAG TPA: hypothetical protein VL688_02755 [Verrucomicrobiae bacterium]|nr:hypothetical protein [Verrucomicrobiae bacterium]